MRDNAALSAKQPHGAAATIPGNRETEQPHRAAAAFLRHRGPSAEEIAKEKAQRRLSEFVRQAWHVVEPGRPFVGGWHLEIVADHLQAVSAGEISDLIINVPFRTSKSLQACVFWPAWVWGPANQPSFQWLFSAYAANLSVRDSLRCRRLVESPWYRARWSNPSCKCPDGCCKEPPVDLTGDRPPRRPPCSACWHRFHLTTDQNQKIRFDNDRMGYRIATSVGGSGTGEGGDAIVVDDPHNVHETESEAIRNGVLTWWNETMPSRSNDPKKRRRVIIGQRVHERDLSGDALARGEYEHLMLPMEYDPKRVCVHAGGCTTPGRETKLGRQDPRTKANELLCPDRFGRKEVDTLKKDLGKYGADAQMQQSPTPRGGVMFKRAWFTKFLKAAPVKVLARVRWWDLAATEDGGDYTVGLKWSLKGPGEYVIEHMVRDQLDSADVRKLVLATSDADGPACRVGLFVDPGQAGKDQKKEYSKLLTGRRFAFLQPTNKESAAELWAGQAGAGNIELVAGDWNEQLLDEVCAFNKGKYDDAVDAGSGAFRWLSGMGVKKAGFGWTKG